MRTQSTNQLWDAIAVNLKTNKVRLFGERRIKKAAEAISMMAVMRRGCDTEFFTEVPSGTYKEGDTYRPSTPPAS